MKNEFVMPEIEIVSLIDTNIIAASNGTTMGGDNALPPVDLSNPSKNT